MGEWECEFAGEVGRGRGCGGRLSPAVGRWQMLATVERMVVLLSIGVGLRGNGGFGAA